MEELEKVDQKRYSRGKVSLIFLMILVTIFPVILEILNRLFDDQNTSEEPLLVRVFKISLLTIIVFFGIFKGMSWAKYLGIAYYIFLEFFLIKSFLAALLPHLDKAFNSFNPFLYLLLLGTFIYAYFILYLLFNKNFKYYFKIRKSKIFNRKV